MINVKNTYKYWLACFLIILAVLSCKQAQPTEESKTNVEAPPTTKENPSSIVTDKKGRSTLVENLEANYTAGGLWMGKRPQKIVPSFNVILKVKESDYITRMEYMEIPFSSMKKISFVWKEIEPEYLPTRKGDDYLAGHLVEMSDGSVIKLSRIYPSTGQKFELFSQTKEALKSYNLEDYWLEMKLDDMGLSLQSFKGQAKADSRKMGDFEIPEILVSTIEFK